MTEQVPERVRREVADTIARLQSEASSQEHKPVTPPRDTSLSVVLMSIAAVLSAFASPSVPMMVRHRPPPKLL